MTPNNLASVEIKFLFWPFLGPSHNWFRLRNGMMDGTSRRRINQIRFSAQDNKRPTLRPKWRKTGQVRRPKKKTSHQEARKKSMKHLKCDSCSCFALILLILLIWRSHFPADRDLSWFNWVDYQRNIWIMLSLRGRWREQWAQQDKNSNEWRWGERETGEIGPIVGYWRESARREH